MSDEIKTSENPFPKKGKIPFPQRDVMTSNQIGNLVQVGIFALNSLTIGQHGEPQNKVELDGGCKSSAEALFLKVCDKLDNILDDGDRWNFEIQNSLEAKLEQMYDQNIKFLAEQHQAAKRINTPHFCYKPNLQSLPDGQWVAYIGELGEDGSICGIGKTPKQALESFDSLFDGSPMPDHLIAWLAEREQREQQQRKEQHAAPVDERRSKTSPGTKGKRKKPPTNS